MAFGSYPPKHIQKCVWYTKKKKNLQSRTLIINMDLNLLILLQD